MRDHIITSPHEVPHKSQSETNNIYIIHTYIYIYMRIHTYIYNINRYDHHIYIYIKIYWPPYKYIKHHTQKSTIFSWPNYTSAAPGPPLRPRRTLVPRRCGRCASCGLGSAAPCWPRRCWAPAARWAGSRRRLGGVGNRYIMIHE